MFLSFYITGKHKTQTSDRFNTRHRLLSNTLGRCNMCMSEVNWGIKYTQRGNLLSNFKIISQKTKKKKKTGKNGERSFSDIFCKSSSLWFVENGMWAKKKKKKGNTCSFESELKMPVLWIQTSIKQGVEISNRPWKVKMKSSQCRHPPLIRLNHAEVWVNWSVQEIIPATVAAKVITVV